MSAPVHFDIAAIRSSHAASLKVALNAALAKSRDEAERKAAQLLHDMHVAGFEMTLLALQAGNDGMPDARVEAVLGSAFGAMKVNLRQNFGSGHFEAGADEAAARTLAGLAGRASPGALVSYKPTRGGRA